MTIFDKQAQHTGVFPQFSPESEEQAEIVALCNQFKTHAQHHAAQKKEQMRTCFAYAKNKFVGGDLLPIPSTQGNDRDNNSNRPQVFIPLTRQQLKTIYAQLKLTIFPNDQDYFRIRAKSSHGVDQEDILTEGLKYLFKEAMISEKIGASLYNLVWSGCFASLPCVKEDIMYEWSFHPGKKDPKTGSVIKPDQYIPRAIKSDPLPDLETFNPLNFYIDPAVQDYERAKWVNVGRKKYQDIQDSDLYFNKDQLDPLVSNNQNGHGLDQLADLNDFSVNDTDDETLLYDLYYFPHLKTSVREYRNMIIGVAGEQVLIRFHPNCFPRGLNPVVFCNWMHDTENPYSTGPVEDLLEIQKTINILWNYKLEVMARAGNRFAVRSNVDLSNFFGVAGGIAVTEDPKNDIINFSGDYSEIASLDNAIGVLKAEGQLVAGSQNPFQGSSNLDYQKTATELQIIQENSISILREVIEHITVMGVRRILERLMYLVADLYEKPLEVPVIHPMRGREFKQVDFSVLKSGEFTMELVSVNPSQSKQAQINGLIQLLNFMRNDSESLIISEPVLEKIGDLVGVKNIRDLLEEVKSRMNMAQTAKQLNQTQEGKKANAQPQRAGIPNPENAMGVFPQSGVAGVSSPPAKREGPTTAR